MFYYAQLDEGNLCIGISQLHSEMDLPQLVPISEAAYMHGECLNRIYENDEWVDAPEPAMVSKSGGSPQGAPVLTDDEILLLKRLLSGVHMEGSMSI